MYIPDEYRCSDRQKLGQVIRDNGFGTLVTGGGSGLFATQIPFLVLSEGPDTLILESHLAKANLQWSASDADKPAMAIFNGPHAYISPTWYGVRPFVPTWNYVTVQATGKIAWIHDVGEIIGVLMRTVHYFEDQYQTAWDPGPSAEYIDRIASGVVAFRMEVTALEGAFKLGQDKAPELQDRVISNLKASGSTAAEGVAQLMASENNRPF